MAVASTPRGYLERPRPSGLADVVDVILDKGIVIDAYDRRRRVGVRADDPRSGYVGMTSEESERFARRSIDRDLEELHAARERPLAPSASPRTLSMGSRSGSSLTACSARSGRLAPVRV